MTLYKSNGGIAGNEKHPTPLEALLTKTRTKPRSHKEEELKPLKKTTLHLYFSSVKK